MIKPTVGRIVWFSPHTDDRSLPIMQRRTASRWQRSSRTSGAMRW